jgi:hypothetical protein
LSLLAEVGEFADLVDVHLAAYRPRRAAASSPLAANRRTTLIAVKVSQLAWFNGRCVRSGVRSPPCRVMFHPFIRGNSLTSADRYLPACSNGRVRAKHG